MILFSKNYFRFVQGGLLIKITKIFHKKTQNVFSYGHGFIGYPKGRNDERALGFSLTGTVSTSPNLAKEGARSATIITRPSGSRFS